MKRRLDLAAALVHNPEVLFLDEPTTGLDPISRAKVWEEVRRLNEQLSMTIFLTTQYLEEADQLAHRVGIINGGKLVAEGTPEELKRTVGTDLVVVEVDGDDERAKEALDRLDVIDSVSMAGDEILAHTADGAAAVSPVAVALAEAGVRVRALTLRTPTLDDVFLELTGNRIQEGEPMSSRHHRRDRPGQLGGDPAPQGRVRRRPRLGGRPGHPAAPARAGVHRPGAHRAGVLLRRERRPHSARWPSPRGRSSTSRRSSSRWPSSSPSPVSARPTPSSPTSRTATSTGCCSRRSAAWPCCSG